MIIQVTPVYILDCMDLNSYNIDIPLYGIIKINLYYIFLSFIFVLCLTITYRIGIYNKKLIFLISFIIVIIILLLCFIFNLKYLLLTLLGLIFLILFVLNIKGSEKIITSYLIRKNINNFIISNNNYKCISLYLFILFIIPVYLWCISSRFFIIINNIFMYFLNRNLDRMSLYLGVIVIILLISNIL